MLIRRATRLSICALALTQSVILALSFVSPGHAQGSGPDLNSTASAETQYEKNTSNQPRSSVAKPLQGAINLDEKLPPLPQKYQTGSQFSDESLQGLTPDNNWFPIPEWLGGSWHSETRTLDYVQDCTTGESVSPHSVIKSVQDAVHGHQKDKTGRIWEYIEIPNVRKVGLTRATAYLRGLQEDCLVSDPSQVVLKHLNNQVTVDDKSKSITESNQVQQIGTYTQLEDGLVRLSASLKNFDADGSPIQLQRMQTVLSRTKPYENMDKLNGHDLKALFEQYLRKTGHQELIP